MFLVEDLMTRELITLKPDDNLAQADTFMNRGRIRHLPVVDSAGRLVGLVTHRDLLKVFADRTREGAMEVRAGDVMTTGVATVTPQTRLIDALNLMIENKYGCLPALDVDGKLVGLITQFDLMKFAAHFVRDLDEVEQVAMKVGGKES
jgi:CBS domain-containing protein